jgi:cytochrome c-type biogenesis protein CcmH/NrfG
MSYWKGLAVAVAIDLVWIMGASTVLAPDLQEPAYTVAEPEPNEVDELIEISERLDSLMMQLQMNPDDVDAMEKVADIYADKGWWDAAIGPLARAIQLDADRWSLWSALDRALEKAGIATITDAELTVRAANFVDEVNAWGHGC